MEEIFCRNNSVFCNPEVKKFLPRIQPTSPLDERVERYQSKTPTLPEFRVGSLGLSAVGVGQRYQFVPTVHETRVNFIPGPPNAAVKRCVARYLNTDEQADEEQILAPEIKKPPAPAPILESAPIETAIETASIVPEPEVINMSLVLADDAPPPKRFSEAEIVPSEGRPVRAVKPPAPLPYDSVLASAPVLDDYDYNSDEEEFSDLEY
jgi:hypothetical protein